MSASFSMDDAAELLQSFSGRAPLLPLRTVLFPQALLPLHIVEARYRQLTQDALQGERLIAIACPKTPKDIPQQPSPEWHGMVGLGRIIAYQQYADGRYHLMLRGLTRAYVLYEYDTPKLYRSGRLQICPDVDPPRTIGMCYARDLLRRFSTLFKTLQHHPLWDWLESRVPPLGLVCDLLVSSLPLRYPVAQQFLQETASLKRYAMLVRLLDQAAPQHPSILSAGWYSLN